MKKAQRLRRTLINQRPSPNSIINLFSSLKYHIFIADSFLLDTKNLSNIIVIHLVEISLLTYYTIFVSYLPLLDFTYSTYKDHKLVTTLYYYKEH